MNSQTLSYDDRRELLSGRTFTWSALWLLWQVVRLPVLALLIVLEPFVSLILTGFGFLGIVMATILKFSGDLPHFPFWLMTAFSVGSILLLMAYHTLLGLLSRKHTSDFDVALSETQRPLRGTSIGAEAALQLASRAGGPPRTGALLCSHRCGRNDR